MIGVLIEQVEPTRNFAVKQTRLGKTDIGLKTRLASRKLQPRGLPVAKQIGVGNRHVANDTFR